MGFHIDMSEVHEAKETFADKVNALSKKLDDSSVSFARIADSKALEGKVGDAIADDVNNIHLPISVAMRDAYKLLVDGFNKEIESFASTVEEHSQSAVLDEDTLSSLKRRLDQLAQDKDSLDSKTRSIYTSIDNIVDISMPSHSAFTRELSDTKEVLTHTINWVHNFESQFDGLSALQDLVSATQSKLNAANRIKGLAFGSSKFNSDVGNADYRNLVQARDKKMRQLEEVRTEKAARLRGEKEFAKQHHLDWGGYVSLLEKGHVSSFRGYLKMVGLLEEYLGSTYAMKNATMGPKTASGDPGFAMTDTVDPARDVGTKVAQRGKTLADLGEKLGHGKIGGGITMATAGLGVANDMLNEHKNLGQAIVHNGASVVVGSVGGKIGGVVVGGVITALGGPATLAAIGGIALGMVISAGFAQLYNRNFMGMQTALDGVGNTVQKSLNNIWKNLTKKTQWDKVNYNYQGVPWYETNQGIGKSTD